MTAYVIADITVTDPERYKGYMALSGPAIAAHGGRFVVRGGGPEVLEGDWEPSRVVVVEFDTVQRARAWYDSPEYREARDAREGAAVMRAVVVEGAAPPPRHRGSAESSRRPWWPRRRRHEERP